MVNVTDISIRTFYNKGSLISVQFILIVEIFKHVYFYILCWANCSLIRSINYYTEYKVSCQVIRQLPGNEYRYYYLTLYIVIPHHSQPIAALSLISHLLAPCYPTKSFLNLHSVFDIWVKTRRGDYVFCLKQRYCRI